MKNISVVIPTYNRLDTLKPVLEHFNEQTVSDFELIVVDSMSSDGTEAFMREFAPKFSLRYIRQENRGRPGARNRGIREAQGEIVFFCDSDIVPEHDLIERHLEFQNQHGNAAAVGWESRIDSLEDLEWARLNPEKRFRIHPPAPKKLSWLYFLTGNVSVPREALIRAGLFDELFQGYGFEDLELGYRLQKSGVKIHYFPSAVNYHVHPRTLANQFETQRMAGRNAALFYQKHRDWKIRWLLGMSPPAFLWHKLVRSVPGLRRMVEGRAKSGAHFAEAVMIQYHYLIGVREAWK